MEARKEQALVGLFVLIASGLLLATIFSISGAFGGAGTSFKASFKFGGGLEPGAVVRYSGGPKVGRVEQLRVDPKDPSRIEITFSVNSDAPVKADSKVRIYALSALAENYVEISPGSPGSPLAKSGALLPSEEFISFADVLGQINSLGPDAQKLVQSLNQRATELKETIDRVNDVINEANRKHLASTLANLNGMLEENRPTIKSTVANVNASTAKLTPLMDDFKKTMEKADKALGQVNDMLGENRPDVRGAISDLRKALSNANSSVDRLNNTLDVNSENIDEMLENMRITTENLKQFTDLIKARPASLLRSSTPSDHKHDKEKKP